ncbi:uncharacterized protein LOC131282853 [Anopheles ziemanni]|uniref:uncharacterized protein LOC131263295 n=1 Tax=Anopheles coustani TaxID=139045 RepID=UPI0026584DD3|nr:uncharacterized protein LOC131263295 [Anopheles coustani]XP_058168379.1 uncharacterized protein LOC131282853 [Anopheles ziemanni]
MSASSDQVYYSVDQFGISKRDLETIWQTYFRSHHAVQVHGRVRSFAKDRVGYLGDHFMLVLESSECSESSVELFLKVLPSGIPALTDYLHSIGTARKESNMYRELLPKMGQFSRFAPQCFLALEPAGQLLVLENLHVQGFRNIPNESAGIFDKEHLKCALVALAKYHSASLLLEKETGESLIVLAPGVLEENAWVRKENNPRVKELDNAIDVLLAMVRMIEKDNPQLIAILEKLPKFMQQIYELVKPSSVYRNVACHGDLWSNNMMFRYTAVDGRSIPLECLIIDYQFTRYAPPAYDLNMLITLTTTGHFRRIHREELIRFYYQRVLEELKCHHLDCDLPGELNEESFYKSCETYKISGLIDNFLMNHVTLLPRDYVNKIFSSAECYNSFSGESKIKMCLEVLENDKVYRERIIGIIRDLIEVI